MLYPVYKTELYDSTVSGLRISSVDGTAFLDNCAALVPYLGNEVLILDGSSRMLRGYLSAAGTGETLDTTVINDGAFTDTANWTEETGAAVSGGKAVFTAALHNNKIYQNATLTSGALYVGSLTIDSISGTGGIKIVFGGTSIMSTTFSTTGAKTSYKTSNGTGAVTGIGAFDGTTTASCDTLSIQQVLTPSTSGATIVTAKGGAIRNFASKNTSFTYNAASYRCIVIGTRRISGNGSYL